MKRLSIPEVLESLENKSSEEKVKILRENDTRSLRIILYLAFSEDVEINLPNERPELKLKEIPKGLGEDNLYRQARKLKIFVKGAGYDKLTNIKRETIFIQILESLCSSESELLLQILIDRKLKSSLEYDEVRSSFPNLLPEISKKVEEEPVVSEPTIEEVEEESEVYKNLSEVYEKNKPKQIEEEPEVYKNLSEVYEKNNKKSKTKKKSSKKKSK